MIRLWITSAYMENISIVQEFIYVFQLFLATLFGALLGYNRQKERKFAGIRTHSLVCLGATLITLVARNIPHIIGVSDQSAVFTVSLSASVMTGIGFLCAGVIMHQREQILGLTTASGLWITAAIGIAVGYGFYVIAFTATFFAFLLIAIAWRVSDRIGNHHALSIEQVNKLMIEEVEAESVEQPKKKKKI